MAGSTAIPKNRASFTASELLGAIARRGALVGDFDRVVGVSTDTRALEAGAAFVAIRGETHDGHDHVEAAREAGAKLAIVERDVDVSGIAMLRVESTLDALGDLSRAHLRRWRSAGEKKVIGITGSAGKTTTRVAFQALLWKLFPNEVHASKGNLNNRVGMPMVIFELEAKHRVAILEMGTNRPGEIAALARVAEPNVGVVTLIAAAHTEFLGTIDDVAIEKGALLRALPPEGFAIGCGDDVRVRRAVSASPAKRHVLYGRALDADVRIESREATSLTTSRVAVEMLGRAPVSFDTPLLGEAGALACAAAIAVASCVFDRHVDASLAAAAFSSAEVGGGAGRLVPRTCKDGLAIIDDSYNANPASCVASIRAASEIARATNKRLVLVLGAMRELGEESAKGHAMVGAAAKESGASAVFAIADDAKILAEHAGAAAEFFSNVDASIAPIAARVTERDLVLVKGSRGVETERVVKELVRVHDREERA